MAEEKDKNTETKPEDNKDQTQGSDKKDTPKPVEKPKETAAEKAKREAEEKAEADRIKSTGDFYTEQLSKLSKKLDTNDSTAVNVEGHIKHINYTLPDIKLTPVGCRVDIGLENIMTEDIKQEFNTYNYFGIFDSFDDVYIPAYDKNGREIYSGPDTTKSENVGIKGGSVPVGRRVEKGSNGQIQGFTVTTGSPAVRSLFNRAGQILIGNLNVNKNNNKSLYWKTMRNEASDWRVALNVPLMDSPSTRKRIREHSGCSVSELVAATKAGDLGRAKYSYADFMYCKHLGRISNNYLITLRRFPIPPGDCITTSGTGKTRSAGRRGIKKAAGESQSVEDMGCLVTWLGTPGNDMNNILKYSVTMPFEEKEARWEDIQVDGDSSQGFLPSIASAFNDSYRKQYCAGYGGTAFNSWVGKHFGLGEGHYDAKSFANFRDQNKIYGPVDVVKKIYKRSENGGLDFKQNITIVFDYELRSYNGVNPRQAMLDLISNILNVTYTSGGWWGGGYKGGGMAQSSTFTNLNIFKNWGGTFTGFCDALQKDYQTLTANLASQVQSAGGILQYCLKLLNNIGGMIMGGLLNKMGRPARAMMNSLLSEQPVGFWHLMVGNPHHPIMSVGNMILKNTTIEHYGPLGLDDFPTGLKVTCELDRGKPRDNREVEKMYMNGNDRIYSSIGPKITDMYQKAAQYKADIMGEDTDVKSNFQTTHGKNLEQNKNDLNKQLIGLHDQDIKTHGEITNQIMQKPSIESHISQLNIKLNEQHKNSKYVDGFITNLDDMSQNFETVAKELTEYYYKNDYDKPLVSLFYKTENGVKQYYTLTYIPKHGEQTKYDPNINMVTMPYPNDNSILDEDELEGYSDSEKILEAAKSSIESIIDAGVPIDLEEKLIAAQNDVTNNYNATIDIRKQISDSNNEIDKINKQIDSLQEERKSIKTQIDNVDKNIKENDELIEMSNKLQAMTSDLDSWNGADLWKKFSKEEQIAVLSKLADTDWYNLLYNWFGQADLYSISMAAQEIEYGSYKKKDTELKTFNPDKVKTAKASVTMLKNSFDRHDWKDEKTMDVSVNHVDGAGNIHKLYVQVSEKEQNGFLEAYKKYLESGDLSDISKYVDNKVEKEKSFTSIDGKVQGLDISKAVVIKPKDPPAPPAVPASDVDPNNPGENGNNTDTGQGSQYNPKGLSVSKNYKPMSGDIVQETINGQIVKVNKTLRDAVISRVNLGEWYDYGGGGPAPYGHKMKKLSEAYMGNCTWGPTTFYNHATGGSGGSAGKINPMAHKWWPGAKPETAKKTGLEVHEQFRLVAQCHGEKSLNNHYMTKIAYPTDIMTTFGRKRNGQGSSHAQMFTYYSGYIHHNKYKWVSDTLQRKEYVYGGFREGNRGVLLFRSNDIYPL